VTKTDVDVLNKERMRKAEESQKFITRTEREEMRQQQLAKFTRIQVKIIFPDKYELTASFAPDEKPCAVFEFLRNFLNKDVPKEWIVYSIPPKFILKENESKSLKQLGYIPAVKLYFELSGNYKGPFVSEDFEAEEKPIIEFKFTENNGGTQPIQQQASDQSNQKQEFKPVTQQKPEEKREEKKVPTWFKTGGGK